MPWQECTTMSIRREFVLLAGQPQSNVRELCRRYEISPKTAYKWLHRHREQGDTGLEDQSRCPLQSPRRSSPELEQEVVRLHLQFPYWGARKLLCLLPDGVKRPHHSTIDAILRRHGCQVRYHAGEAQAPATRRFEHERPNELWQIDFKGNFHLSDRHSPRCHPLTVLDDHSRFALCLESCEGERLELVRPKLIQVFRRYGLPRRITADNGPPWGSNIEGGLSTLEVWLMRLGIEVSDLGLAWVLELDGDRLRAVETQAEASVRGSATDLLLLASRLEDADTLFFQRRLEVTGDTELGLTARNLLDRLPWESVPLGVRILLNRGARLARQARNAHRGEA